MQAEKNFSSFTGGRRCYVRRAAFRGRSRDRTPARAAVPVPYGGPAGIDFEVAVEAAVVSAAGPADAVSGFSDWGRW